MLKASRGREGRRWKKRVGKSRGVKGKRRRGEQDFRAFPSAKLATTPLL